MARKTKLRKQDWVGKNFGLWTVKSIFRSQGNRSLMSCVCECGNRRIVLSRSLKSGKSKSCGCSRIMNVGDITGAKDVFRYYLNNHPGNLTFEDFYRLSKLPCHWCGIEPQNRRNPLKGRRGEAFIYSGLDRLDSNGVHDLKNCVPCCFQCNRAKSHWKVNEFLAMVKRVYEKHLSR